MANCSVGTVAAGDCTDVGDNEEELPEATFPFPLSFLDDIATALGDCGSGDVGTLTCTEPRISSPSMVTVRVVSLVQATRSTFAR